MKETILKSGTEELSKSIVIFLVSLKLIIFNKVKTMYNLKLNSHLGKVMYN